MKILTTMGMALALVLSVIMPAAAYIGPGAGLSLLGAFWGLLLAVGAALGFVILWPLRRLFRRGKALDHPVGQSGEPVRVASEPRPRTF
jgi:hypothetical protein